MKTRNIIFIAIGVAVLAAVGIGLSMYFKPHKDFGASAPEYTLSARALVDEFTRNESAAMAKYVAEDKTVQVSGLVRDVSAHADGSSTVTLDAGEGASVTCTLMPDQREHLAMIKPGGNAQFKGQVTGMQALIDREVVMIRCVMVH